MDPLWLENPEKTGEGHFRTQGMTWHTSLQGGLLFSMFILVYSQSKNFAPMLCSNIVESQSK